MPMVGKLCAGCRFPTPTNISGIQSGSSHRPTFTVPPPPFGSAAAFSSRSSSLASLFFSRFTAFIYSDWSSLKTIPVPVPVFEEPAFGIGIEYFVPRSLYWKFFLRCTCTLGFASWPLGSGAVVVIDVRKRDGFPHVGQNFFDGSLQSLTRCEGGVSSQSRYHSLEASMTAKNPALDARDPLALDTDQIETHMQEHVLHREVRCHTPHLYLFSSELSGLLGVLRQQIECSRFVYPNVRGCNPFTFVVIIGARVIVD